MFWRPHDIFLSHRCLYFILVTGYIPKNSQFSYLICTLKLIFSLLLRLDNQTKPLSFFLFLISKFIDFISGAESESNLKKMMALSEKTCKDDELLKSRNQSSSSSTVSLESTSSPSATSLSPKHTTTKVGKGREN